jgi:hypothetical protein
VSIQSVAAVAVLALAIALIVVTLTFAAFAFSRQFQPSQPPRIGPPPALAAPVPLPRISAMPPDDACTGFPTEPVPATAGEPLMSREEAGRVLGVSAWAVRQRGDEWGLVHVQPDGGREKKVTARSVYKALAEGTVTRR